MPLASVARVDGRRDAHALHAHQEIKFTASPSVYVGAASAAAHIEGRAHNVVLPMNDSACELFQGKQAWVSLDVRHSRELGLRERAHSQLPALARASTATSPERVSPPFKEAHPSTGAAVEATLDSSEGELPLRPGTDGVRQRQPRTPIVRGARDRRALVQRALGTGPVTRVQDFPAESHCAVCMHPRHRTHACPLLLVPPRTSTASGDAAAAATALERRR